jgi:hypothetical protein
MVTQHAAVGFLRLCPILIDRRLDGGNYERFEIRIRMTGWIENIVTLKGWQREKKVPLE